jgi:hypothetical protein
MVEITVDERRRTSLAKVGRRSDERYLVDEFEDGTLVLTPAITMSKAEAAALADPVVRAALEKSLEPNPQLVSRGSFPSPEA